MGFRMLIDNLCRAGAKKPAPAPASGARKLRGVSSAHVRCVAKVAASCVADMMLALT